MQPAPAAFVSILFASLIFSGVHYVGLLGDTFELRSFFFRAVAGVVLSIIFLLRGLGIALYTLAVHVVLLVIGLLFHS